jgi:hypothetical protein
MTKKAQLAEESRKRSIEKKVARDQKEANALKRREQIAQIMADARASGSK